LDRGAIPLQGLWHLAARRSLSLIEPPIEFGQGSLTLWWNTRALPQPILVDLAGRSLAEVQRELRATGLDYLLLDCPPGLSPFQREAIRAADLVLMPTGASVLDLVAVASTAEMADQAGVPLRFVLNRAVFRSRLAGWAVAEPRERGRLLPPPVHLRGADGAGDRAGAARRRGS